MIKNVKEQLQFTKAELDAAAEFIKAKGDVTSGGEFVGGFDGCVKHMMDTKNLPKDNAEKLCAFIGRQAGKIKSKSMAKRISDMLRPETKS